MKVNYKTKSGRISVLNFKMSLRKNNVENAAPIISGS